MKIAVLGAGISGLGSAYILSKKYEVDLYEKDNRLGGHARTTMVEENGKKGVRFAVWAPHAKSVSVVGDFNEWDTRKAVMS